MISLDLQEPMRAVDLNLSFFFKVIYLYHLYPKSLDSFFIIITIAYVQQYNASTTQSLDLAM